MALTQEERETYHELVQRLYGGTVSSSPSQITEDVADIVNTILDEAVECSKAVAITQALISLLFPSTSVISFTKNLVKTGYSAIMDWLAASEGNEAATACIESAKLNWRSRLELALLGM